MAHGLPDYYRGVDIAYQALSEMIIRPKYGGAQQTKGAQAVAASTETTLATISGKGMIYGGYILCDGVSSQKLDVPHLYIDDQDFGNASFEGLELWGLNTKNCVACYLLRYNSASFYYGVGLSEGYTFEESLKLTYEEKSGNTPAVLYSAIYAVI